MKPTNSPTQGQPNPRKNRLKSGSWATFSQSKYFYVGWDWFCKYWKQTTRNLTQANALILLIILIPISGLRETIQAWHTPLYCRLLMIDHWWWTLFWDMIELIKVYHDWLDRSILTWKKRHSSTAVRSYIVRSGKRACNSSKNISIHHARVGHLHPTTPYPSCPGCFLWPMLCRVRHDSVIRISHTPGADFQVRLLDNQEGASTRKEIRHRKTLGEMFPTPTFPAPPLLQLQQ